MAKPIIGDVVEIKTSKGLAYAHYTHQHKQYGALLRVFHGFHETRPVDFMKLVMHVPIFSCFFPLNAAVERKIVSLVSNVTPSVEALTFPTFRAGIIDPATRKVGVWWLWDGEKEWKVGELTSVQRRFPIRGVWNDTLLVERIESGWTAKTDPT
jgi:hypothetical protein